MGSLVKRGFMRRRGSITSRWTPIPLASYREASDGQILQEGICETGAMASFLAAGTAYANFAVPTIPFYIFYSIFGFQRVGDMIWAAGDAMARGFCWGTRAHHLEWRRAAAPGRLFPAPRPHRAEAGEPTTRPSPSS